MHDRTRLLRRITDRDLLLLEATTAKALDQAARAHEWSRCAEAQQFLTEVVEERQARSEGFRRTQTTLDLGV